MILVLLIIAAVRKWKLVRANKKCRRSKGSPLQYADPGESPAETAWRLTDDKKSVHGVQVFTPGTREHLNNTNTINSNNSIVIV